LYLKLAIIIIYNYAADKNSNVILSEAEEVILAKIYDGLRLGVP
jgi:hypothetical protein